MTDDAPTTDLFEDLKWLLETTIACGLPKEKEKVIEAVEAGVCDAIRHLTTKVTLDEDLEGLNSVYRLLKEYHEKLDGSWYENSS